MVASFLETFLEPPCRFITHLVFPSESMASADDDFLPTCDPTLRPKAAQRGRSPFTPRRAVDRNGRVGSLYDARADRVLSGQITNLHYTSISRRSTATCYIQQHEVGEVSRLLRMINMHGDLRLNVTLETTPPTGIGALINYSRPIDRYTRFMVYFVLSRTEYLSDKEIDRLHENKGSLRNVEGTHVIILVNYGIDVVVVLQLPPDDRLASQIDRILDQVCYDLGRNNVASSWMKDQKRRFSRIQRTEVFSNITFLTEIQTIPEFYRRIFAYKDKYDLHPPYNYNLSPIGYLFTVTNPERSVFQTFPADQVDQLEHYILQMKLPLREMSKAMEQGFPHCQIYLRESHDALQSEWSRVSGMYREEIRRLQAWLDAFLRDAFNRKTLYEVLKDEKAKNLAKQITPLSTDLRRFQAKDRFIGELLPKEFEYRNITACGVKDHDDERSVQRKLAGDKKEIRILCGTDELCQRSPTEWNTLCDQVREDLKKNPSSHWIYADFSYCSYKLDRLKILPTPHQQEETVPQSSFFLTSKQEGKDEIFNVLLLGESGVGKSTFINAFVNYLQFETFKEAQTAEPIVLLPISFIITHGTAFEEQNVTYDGLDSSSNEDHEHAGQSVTQHCKSYLFTLKDEKHNGRKVRLIDTPGIGDVRGVDQDDRNMQDILSFISSLTHLHAICIVMKPNVTRLNIAFPSCLAQLFDLLGEKARDHILFCFTNTRATFYGPGDTAPVLKKLLASLPVTGVPFGKANSFCFDSESFRYLVAKKCGVQFENDQLEQYEESWKRSSEESKRLFQCVTLKGKGYLIDQDHKSRTNAQLKINLLIRPILEAMRNNLRNIVLIKAKTSRESIQLYPKSITGQKFICSHCVGHSQQDGDLWILFDPVHDVSKWCRTCSCPLDKHLSVHYQLEFKRCAYPPKESEDQLETVLSDLCRASALFALFLANGSYTAQRDPILRQLKTIIENETYTYKQKPFAPMNEALVTRLIALEKEYQEAVKREASRNARRSDGSYIYDCIDRISEHKIIESQMAAVREWQKTLLQSSEFTVPT